MQVKQLRNACQRALTPYYFITFPKSGRTWSKSFLANYYACMLDLPLFYDFAPLWRSGRRSRVPRVVFTHTEHRDEPAAAVTRSMRRVRGKRVILQVRDPRSVAFTYYFRLIKRMQDSQTTQLELADFIRHPDLGIPRIVRFLNDWYAYRENFQAFTFLRYEDCVKKPEEEYARLLQFLATEVEIESVQEALRRSVDTTRKIEEGGLARDKGLVQDIARGSEYFEANSGCLQTTTRYQGDDAAYVAAFNAEDRHFMNQEIKKLHPDFGYGNGEY